MEFVRPIKMCFNETHSTVRTGKHLTDNFLIQNGLKQGDVLLSLLFNLALEYVIRKVQENQVRLKWLWLTINQSTNLCLLVCSIKT
jgi:hypothetical protein